MLTHATKMLLKTYLYMRRFFYCSSLQKLPNKHEIGGTGMFLSRIIAENLRRHNCLGMATPMLSEIEVPGLITSSRI